MRRHNIVSKRSQGYIDHAWEFANNAHYWQKIKYTREPYIVHPVAVATLVASVTEDCDMIAAALLHDVVEDTEFTIEDLKNNDFGFRTVQFVTELTEFSLPNDGNRKVRKALDLRYLARASAQAKTIKLADLIDNSKSIILHDPNFSKIYMKEKRELLKVLSEGDETLFHEATHIVEDYFS